MANRRTERVSELVKRQVGEIIQELNLTNCGLITVTEAVISPDLHEGRVYVSVIGRKEQQQHALSTLEHCHGRIQRELAHRVILKYTPKLKFFLDETETHAQHIEQLLDELKVPHPDE